MQEHFLMIIEWSVDSQDILQTNTGKQMIVKF